MAFGYLSRGVVKIGVESKIYTNDSYGKERERREKSFTKEERKVGSVSTSANDHLGRKEIASLKEKPKMT